MKYYSILFYSILWVVFFFFFYISFSTFCLSWHPQFSLPFLPSLYKRWLVVPHRPQFLFSGTYTLLFFIKSALCPYSQHLSVAREHSVCCCAVVWYMYVFGHSVHSGEPDWSGRSKQREETWQRKHTCTQTHSQILECRLQWSYYYCPVLQNLLRAWTWPWHKTAQQPLLIKSHTVILHMIHADSKYKRRKSVVVCLRSAGDNNILSTKLSLQAYIQVDYH